MRRCGWIKRWGYGGERWMKPNRPIEIEAKDMSNPIGLNGGIYEGDLVGTLLRDTNRLLTEAGIKCS